MAQRRRSETAARHDFVRGCAFVSLIIAALFYLAGGIIRKWFPLIGSILSLVASLALLLAIAIPAWEFVSYRRTGWKVVYWIALVVYILGAIFGLVFGS